MISDPTNLLPRLLVVELASCHPLVRGWSSAEHLQETFATEIAPDIDRLTDNAFASSFHAAAPIAGCCPDDYRMRRFDVGGEVVLAGIAFLGMDIGRPFVHVARHSGVIEDDAGRDRIRDCLLDAFAPFRPERVRMYQASHLAYQFPGCDGDLRVMGAPLETVRSARVDVDASVELRPASDVSWYERYREAYEAVHRERPWIRDVATVESAETLEGYRRESMLFEVLVDGEWGGVCAAFESRMCGIDGYCVGEMLLDGRHRGRGLGPVVQQRMGALLPLKPGACLFGTIGAVNTHALRAAARVGRVDIGGCFWCDR